MKNHFLGHASITAEMLATLGGKASNLHVLKLNGFQVPAGFILHEPRSSLIDDVDEIGGFPVAVRSSCSMEDLPNASFAGLYETFLYVKDLTELQKTIELCFESKKSTRVKDYLNTKGISASPESLSMSVLVQKMIDPLMAGVLFTLNPVNGFEEEFYLEYCQGVGERLVSGHVTPSSCSFNIQKNVIESEFINTEKTKIEQHILLKLVQESKKIQAFFGTPQDIEWAIDKNNQLHILQSRPITTFSYRTDVPEMTNADLKDGGISARVCTRFMYSAYRNAMQVSMGDYFKKINLIKKSADITWIYNYYGRVYWNAGAVKEGLKRIPGFNEEDFDRDLGIQKDYGAQGPYKTKLTVSTLLNAIPVVFGLHREFKDCEEMVENFKDLFEFRDELLKEKLKSISSMSDEVFHVWLLDVIQFQVLTEQNYFRTIYNNSNFQTEFKTALKKINTYQPGDELEVMGSLAAVSHLNVQEDLSALAQKAEFFGIGSDAYLKQRDMFLSIHYHHGPAELDITVPRWGENKEWVDDLVRSFTPSPHKSSIEFDKTVARLEGGVNFFARNRFKKNLNRSRNFLIIREEMRAFSTRAYYLLRLGMLEFGNRAQIPSQELFMLDLNEVTQILSSNKVELPNLKERLTHYNAYRGFVSPNDFGGTIIQSTGTLEAGALKGIGCSSGELTGRARVILDIHKTGTLTKNEILVTLFTDPGWTPVLARVGGVITEVGGLLSHAAVIGREYGIPAILNVTGATKLIKDGSLIRINGKTGVIEILEEGS